MPQQQQTDSPTLLKDRPDWGLMRLSEVLEVIPVKDTTWYKGIREGKFPKGAPLGARTKVWTVKQIKDLSQRISQGELA